MDTTLTFTRFTSLGPLVQLGCRCDLCRFNKEKEMGSSLGVDFGYTSAYGALVESSNGEKIKRAKLSPEDRLLIRHGVTDRNGDVKDIQLVLNRLFETVKADIVADLQEVEALAKAEK